MEVATFSLPTLDNVKDSDATMGVLIAAYAQHISRRGGQRRPSLLLFDEFGALAGGRPLAINIVERARSSDAGVLLSAQSAAGLGDERDRERLIAAAASRRRRVPSGWPAASLDPPSSRARRHRPPEAGGQAAPPADRPQG